LGFPAFFDQVPRITLRDPLAEFLGAAEGGLIEYSYTDAVRLAGHSCPTVAGAYLLTCRALQGLYPGEVPERGRVLIRCGGAQEDGVVGVMAGVMGLLTGATGSGGFKGLGGRFSRRGLLQFDGGGDAATFHFQRADSGACIALSLNLGMVPADPRMGPLLQAILMGQGSPVIALEFRDLWQDRVRRILLDHWDDPELVCYGN